jgi:hypothetical protein
VSGLSFEATVVRLARLAAARGGTVAAADVEQDELLARDRGTTAAAARMLAGGTEVVSSPVSDPERWFPYASLTFTRMSPGGASPTPGGTSESGGG